MPPAVVAVASGVLAASSVYSAGIVIFGTTVVAAGSVAAAVAVGVAVAAVTYTTMAMNQPQKPEDPGMFTRQMSDNLITVRQAAPPRRSIYGRTRSGGFYTFMHATGDDNKNLHTVITLTGHPVRSFDAVYVDDLLVDLDEDGNALGKYAGKLRVVFGLGTTAGDAAFHEALTNAVGAEMWSAEHRQEGCAKAYVEFIYDSDTYGGGMPDVSFVIAGYNTVFDPRAGISPQLETWTDNAALCTAQWLRDTARGLGFGSDEINEDALIAAANACDEMVDRNEISVTFTVDTGENTLELADSSAAMRTGTRFRVAASGGGSLPGGLQVDTDYFWSAITLKRGMACASLAAARGQVPVDLTSAGSGTFTATVNGEPRYTLNGMVDSSDDPDQILPRLLSAMAGRKTEIAGQIVLLAGVWREPERALDESLLDGAVRSTHRRSRDQLYNGVKGVFTNPDDAWTPTDFPAVKPPQWLAEDGGERIWRDAELRYTDSPSMAQRIVRIQLEQNRRQQTMTAPLNLRGLEIAAGMNLSVDNAKRGWDAKTFTVSKWGLELREDDRGLRLGTVVVCDEEDEACYAWNPLTDEASMQPSPRTNLPDPLEAVAPTGLALESGTDVLGVRLDGTVFSRLRASWTAPADAQVTSGGTIETEYKKSADSNWRAGPVVRGDQTEAFILDVDDGEQYQVRVRSRRGGALQVASAWVVSGGHTVVGKTAPPANVVSLGAQQNGNVVTFRWPAVTDLDLNGYELRYQAEGVPFDWDNANVLTRSTRGTLITNAGLAPGTWIIGIKAVDTSGNYSGAAATTTLTVNNTFDVVFTRSEAPRWPGVRSGFIKHDVSGTLIPDSNTLAADMSDAELWDEMTHDPVAVCTYTAREIDLGFEASGTRLWGSLAAELGPGEGGVADPVLEVDYRSSAGAYDGFEEWSIGTADGRYLKAQAKIVPASGVAALISFSFTADVEERDEGGAGIVVAPGGSAIAFAQQFHFAPAVAVQSVTAARYAIPAGETATGFTAHVYDAAGADVGGTVNWSARGV